MKNGREAAGVRFTFTPELTEWIARKKIHGIIIEVAQCDGDFSVTELHTHFVSDKQAAGFVKRKGFHAKETELCAVYLPDYRLEYEDTVRFDLKRIGPFAMVRAEGVRL